VFGALASDVSGLHKNAGSADLRGHGLTFFKMQITLLPGFNPLTCAFRAGGVNIDDED
jgi:hypothetical protein